MPRPAALRSKLESAHSRVAQRRVIETRLQEATIALPAGNHGKKLLRLGAGRIPLEREFHIITGRENAN